jgi:hypothetical protein
LLEEAHPAEQQAFALGVGGNIGLQIDRLLYLQPRAHGGDAVGVAHLLHLRPQTVEGFGGDDLVPDLDAAFEVGRLISSTT